MALIFRRVMLKGPSGHFAMELPPYRLPQPFIRLPQFYQGLAKP
ncbi:hypothetical protein M1N15_01775 [Dehalococcoidia bacterium]|nr:hypothetical protein [Dehalococcoidia bacterium]